MILICDSGASLLASGTNISVSDTVEAAIEEWMKTFALPRDGRFDVYEFANESRSVQARVAVVDVEQRPRPVVIA